MTVKFKNQWFLNVFVSIIEYMVYHQSILFTVFFSSKYFAAFSLREYDCISPFATPSFRYDDL